MDQINKEEFVSSGGKCSYVPPVIKVQKVELENLIMLGSIHPTDTGGNVKVNSWNQQPDQSPGYWQGGNSFWQ